MPSATMNTLPDFLRLCLVAACITAPAAAVDTADASIIPNGNFETDLDDDQWPDGWGRGDGISWGEEKGNRFLRLTQPAPGAMTSVYLKIPIAPEVRRYRLSFRVRSRDIVRGTENWHTGRLIMHHLDANGNKVKPNPVHPAFTGTIAAWQEQVRILDIPEGTVAFEFMPALMHANFGTLDMDDITLTPMSD